MTARSDLKYNFLKNVIIRADFNGVLEKELDTVFSEIKRYLKSKGFDRYEPKKIGQIADEIIIDTSQRVITPTINRNIQDQTVHQFDNENNGYSVSISNSFVVLNIHSTSYAPFETYSTIVTDLIKIFDKNIDFVSLTRLGIRKINECILMRQDVVKEVFAPNYFTYFDLPEGQKTVISEKLDVFRLDSCGVNLRFALSPGRLEIPNNSEKYANVYSAKLDIDAYVDDPSRVKTVIFNMDKINEMNKIIFDIFIRSLTEKFINALSNDGDPLLNDIIGVESNE